MDASTVSNMIAAVSVLVATVALVVAIKAQRANYRLAARIANAPGRLHAALIQYALGQDGQPIIELTCVNGPSEVTLRAISLGITYHERGSSLWLPGAFCRFWVETADDLSLFGVTGPNLPMRLGAYSEAVWNVPRRSNLPDGDRVVYKFKAYTAHRDKSLEAEPLDFANYRGPSPLLFWMRSGYTCHSGFSLCLPSLPETVQSWIYQREPGSGDTSPASKPT